MRITFSKRWRVEMVSIKALVLARFTKVERARADLERRRAARLLWNGGASDTHDSAPA
jgi:hypothetical protein